MRSLFGCLVAVLALLALPLRASGSDSIYLTNGYSLLYQLADQEKPVDMIMLVKTTPKNLADYLHQVAGAAKDDLNLLDELRAHDKALNFDQRGLPKCEEDTREAIDADEQHLLLFGTKDSAFVRTLLVTQIEAATYGMNLAKVLADAEPNAHRAAVVRKIGDRWEKLRDRAYALLSST